jgi:hypothetical protein
MNGYSKKLAEKARKWIASSEGQDSIRESIREAKESSRKFKESRQLDPKILKEAFNI